MKRFYPLIFPLALVLCIAGCSGSGNVPGAPGAGEDGPGISNAEEDGPGTSNAGEDSPDVSEPPAGPADEDGEQSGNVDISSDRILVAYFSRAGENYNVGVIEKGNTAVVAELVAEMTGGDLFEIEPVEPYPVSYEETTLRAARESDENARPDIAGTVDNMDEYDTVFIGYPVWAVDLPMIVYNFLESYDFSGKTVIPFNTHGGSGQAWTQSTIESMLPDATVLDGIAILGETAQNDPDAVREELILWLTGFGVSAEGC